MKYEYSINFTPVTDLTLLTEKRNWYYWNDQIFRLCYIIISYILYSISIGVLYVYTTYIPPNIFTYIQLITLNIPTFLKLLLCSWFMALSILILLYPCAHGYRSNVRIKRRPWAGVITTLVDPQLPLSTRAIKVTELWKLCHAAPEGCNGCHWSSNNPIPSRLHLSCEEQVRGSPGVHIVDQLCCYKQKERRTQRWSIPHHITSHRVAVEKERVTRQQLQRDGNESLRYASSLHAAAAAWEDTLWSFDCVQIELRTE